MTKPTSQFANGIDLDRLRLSQDFASQGEVEKLLLAVPVRKPNPQSFVRIHHDPKYQFPTAILKLKEENEHFLVAQDLWSELFNEIIPVTLFLGITRDGTLFLWPNRLPGEDGRINEWHRSERTAITEATSHWIRIRANRQLGGYEVFRATSSLPEPVWPQHTMEEVINIAFRDHFIDDHHHPVLKRLRGDL